MSLSNTAKLKRRPSKPRTSVARWVLYVVVGLIILYLIFPILVVIPLSFSSAHYLTFPPPGFSLQWYHKFFSRSDWRNAAFLSLWIACSVMVLATALGTAASLGLVRGLPFEVVKIDRQLVSSCPVRRECAAIVRATSSMAHALGLRVVAQGVESEEQGEQMAELGCDAAQGHYFAEPTDAARVLELARDAGPDPHSQGAESEAPENLTLQK